MRTWIGSLLGGITLFGCVAASGSASATTYEFTYDFVDSDLYASSEYASSGVISGLFTGTGTINHIAVTSVLSLSLDGTGLAGPFTTSHYVPGPGNPPQNGFALVAGGAVVSADSSSSNFFFGNASTGAYFYVIQPWDNPPNQTLAEQLVTGTNGPVVDTYNGQFIASNFSVTAAPEGATWAMLLIGFAGLGFAGYRQHRASKLA